MSDRDALLKPGAAAKYLGISYQKLLRSAKVGEIPSVRSGKQFRFRRADLKRWRKSLEAQQKAIARGDLLTPEAVAAHLDISLSTLRRKVREGEIPCLRAHNKMCFLPEKIAEYLGEAKTSSGVQAIRSGRKRSSLLDVTTWRQRRARLADSNALTLELLFTLPPEAFEDEDSTDGKAIHFWSEGAITVAVVRTAPDHFTVLVKWPKSKWRTVDEVETLYEARWAACDAVWRAVHEEPQRFDEAYMRTLQAASLYLHRRQIYDDVQAWYAAIASEDADGD